MLVTWEARPNGTAWVSVGYTDKGRHFQCNYHGCMEEGPSRISDFGCDPPAWVIEALELQPG